MRKRTILFFNLILVSVISFCYNNQLFGQDKVNVSVGIGIAELLNIGVRFQLEQAQIGLGFGFIPLKDESLISFSGDFYYHFAGLSELSGRRPWYGRMGLGYTREETINFIDKILYLNVRIGRDFNISNRIGIAIDGGANIQLFHDEIRKQPGWGWDLEFPVIPSIGIAVYYRL